jgi:hypothetical protein
MSFHVTLLDECFIASLNFAFKRFCIFMDFDVINEIVPFLANVIAILKIAN